MVKEVQLKYQTGERTYQKVFNWCCYKNHCTTVYVNFLNTQKRRGMVPLKKLSGLTLGCLFGQLIDCSKQQSQSTSLQKYADLQRARAKNERETCALPVQFLGMECCGSYCHGNQYSSCWMEEHHDHEENVLNDLPYSVMFLVPTRRKTPSMALRTAVLKWSCLLFKETKEKTGGSFKER